MNITIIYGTETGNGELLAEDVQAELQHAHTVTVRNMADCTEAVFGPDRLVLLIVSTYGDGELPASAKRLYAELEAGQPSLTGARFAIFGLGDRHYKSTFGRGSERFEALLLKLDAARVGSRSVHDASGPDYAEDQMRAWLEQVLGEAATTSAATDLSRS
jgi:MioC protein